MTIAMENYWRIHYRATTTTTISIFQTNHEHFWTIYCGDDSNAMKQTAVIDLLTLIKKKNVTHKKKF